MVDKSRHIRDVREEDAGRGVNIVKVMRRAAVGPRAGATLRKFQSTRLPIHRRATNDVPQMLLTKSDHTLLFVSL